MEMYAYLPLVKCSAFIMHHQKSHPKNPGSLWTFLSSYLVIDIVFYAPTLPTMQLCVLLVIITNEGQSTEVWYAHFSFTSPHFGVQFSDPTDTDSSDITWGDLSDCVQLPPASQRASNDEPTTPTINTCKLRHSSLNPMAQRQRSRSNSNSSTRTQGEVNTCFTVTRTSTLLDKILWWNIHSRNYRWPWSNIKKWITPPGLLVYFHE